MAAGLYIHVSYWFGINVLLLANFAHYLRGHKHLCTVIKYDFVLSL